MGKRREREGKERGKREERDVYRLTCQERGGAFMERSAGIHTPEVGLGRGGRNV